MPRSTRKMNKNGEGSFARDYDQTVLQAPCAPFQHDHLSPFPQLASAALLRPSLSLQEGVRIAERWASSCLFLLLNKDQGHRAAALVPEAFGRGTAGRFAFPSLPVPSTTLQIHATSSIPTHQLHINRRLCHKRPPTGGLFAHVDPHKSHAVDSARGRQTLPSRPGREFSLWPDPFTSQLRPGATAASSIPIPSPPQCRTRKDP
jgi:hypothetical protein